jgi:hypothetical protein
MNIIKSSFPESSNKKATERVSTKPMQTYSSNLHYYTATTKARIRVLDGLLNHAIFTFKTFIVRTINNALKITGSLGENIIINLIPEDPVVLKFLKSLNYYRYEKTNSYHFIKLCFEKLVRKTPEDITSRAMLGLCHKALGDEETFIKTFKELPKYQLQNNILNRTTIIQHLINKFNYKTYLEIGVERGINFFQIDVELKIGVDPYFIIPGGYKATENEKFYEVTSDEFFKNPPQKILEEGLDIVFIDGLHTYEQSLRDVENSLKYLNAKGVIVLHDCLPDSPAAAMPSLEEAEQHPDFRGVWTGDVYKTIIHLRTTRPDLFVVVIDTDWGVGIIRKGKPESMLSMNTEDIKNMAFDEFAKNKEKFLNLKPKEWFYDMLHGKI